VAGLTRTGASRHLTDEVTALSARLQPAEETADDTSPASGRPAKSVVTLFAGAVAGPTALRQAAVAAGRLEWWQTALLFVAGPVLLFAAITVIVLAATRGRPPRSIPVLGAPEPTQPSTGLVEADGAEGPDPSRSPTATGPTTPVEEPAGNEALPDTGSEDTGGDDVAANGADDERPDGPAPRA
jgi:hypothetical protein